MCTVRAMMWWCWVLGWGRHVWRPGGKAACPNARTSLNTTCRHLPTLPLTPRPRPPFCLPCYTTFYHPCNPTPSPHTPPPSTENPKIFTECGHHFHMPCIYAWLERKDTCPMCESPMQAPGLM